MDGELVPMALCNDAVVRHLDDGTWELVGDPTEGALVVLAAKGGFGIDELRRRHPRVAEVPVTAILIRATLLPVFLLLLIPVVGPHVVLFLALPTGPASLSLVD